MDNNGGEKPPLKNELRIVEEALDALPQEIPSSIEKPPNFSASQIFLAIKRYFSIKRQEIFEEEDYEELNRKYQEFERFFCYMTNTLFLHHDYVPPEVLTRYWVLTSLELGKYQTQRFSPTESVSERITENLLTVADIIRTLGEMRFAKKDIIDFWIKSLEQFYHNLGVESDLTFIEDDDEQYEPESISKEFLLELFENLLKKASFVRADIRKIFVELVNEDRFEQVENLLITNLIENFSKGISTFGDGRFLPVEEELDSLIEFITSFLLKNISEEKLLEDFSDRSLDLEFFVKRLIGGYLQYLLMHGLIQASRIPQEFYFFRDTAISIGSDMLSAKRSEINKFVQDTVEPELEKVRQKNSISKLDFLEIVKNAETNEQKLREDEDLVDLSNFSALETLVSGMVRSLIINCTEGDSLDFENDLPRFWHLAFHKSVDLVKKNRFLMKKGRRRNMSDRFIRHTVVGETLVIIAEELVGTQLIVPEHPAIAPLLVYDVLAEDNEDTEFDEKFLPHFSTTDGKREIEDDSTVSSGNFLNKLKLFITKYVKDCKNRVESEPHFSLILSEFSNKVVNKIFNISRFIINKNSYGKNVYISHLKDLVLEIKIETGVYFYSLFRKLGENQEINIFVQCVNNFNNELDALLEKSLKEFKQKEDKVSFELVSENEIKLVEEIFTQTAEQHPTDQVTASEPNSDQFQAKKPRLKLADRLKSLVVPDKIPTILGTMKESLGADDDKECRRYFISQYKAFLHTPLDNLRATMVYHNMISSTEDISTAYFDLIETLINGLNFIIENFALKDFSKRNGSTFESFKTSAVEYLQESLSKELFAQKDSALEDFQLINVHIAVRDALIFLAVSLKGVSFDEFLNTSGFSAYELSPTAIFLPTKDEWFNKQDRSILYPLSEYEKNCLTEFLQEGKDPDLEGIADKLNATCHAPWQKDTIGPFRTGDELLNLLEKWERDEMGTAVRENFKDSEINYELFFTQYTQTLLANRFRQFFYSLINPFMTPEQVEKIGLNIDKALQILFSRLENEISGLYKQNDEPITLKTLQNCFCKLSASSDLFSACEIPHNIETQLKPYILDFLAERLTEIVTPQDLFAAYPVALPSNDEAVSIKDSIKNEVSFLLSIKKRERITPLMENAKKDYRQCLGYLDAIGFISTDLQRKLQTEEERNSAQENLDRLESTLNTLRYSLYSSFDSQTDDLNDNLIDSHLQFLRSVLEELNIRLNKNQDLNAMEEISNLSAILNALLFSIYKNL